MIGEAQELISPEIQPGLLVVFRNPDDPRFDGDPANREWQEGTYRTYPNPLKVRLRLGEHVVLVPRDAQIDPEDPCKYDMHFGSTCDTRLHVGHVKLYL